MKIIMKITIIIKEKIIEMIIIIIIEEKIKGEENFIEEIIIDFK